MKYKITINEIVEAYDRDGAIKNIDILHKHCRLIPERSNIFEAVTTHLDDHLELLFCKLQDELGIDNGDIAPINAITMSNYRDQLAELITDVLLSQLGEEE